MRRGQSIPLKVGSSVTAEAILSAAVKKHSVFNKRFDCGVMHKLAFRYGSFVEHVPGTDPPEPFTLLRYKEMSRFGYSWIYLYLIPYANDFTNDSNDEEISMQSFDEVDQLPPVSWLDDLDCQKDLLLDSDDIGEPNVNQCR